MVAQRVISVLILSGCAATANEAGPASAAVVAAGDPAAANQGQLVAVSPKDKPQTTKEPVDFARCEQVLSAWTAVACMRASKAPTERHRD